MQIFSSLKTRKVFVLVKIFFFVNESSKIQYFVFFPLKNTKGESCIEIYFINTNGIPKYFGSISTNIPQLHAILNIFFK